MKSAFISHSWHDKRLARVVADAIQQIGGRVWLDEAEIRLGDSLVEKIRAGIDSVDYVVALISKNSVASEWVSKELDIAMNQEIEGRRVKVLPVLASKCSLPGFLKGKLYADMSSSKAIQRSLPMLLERLEAPSEAIAQLRTGKSPKDLSDSRWVAELRQGLASNDPATRYQALKKANTWRSKDLLTDLGTLDELFGLLDESSPTHVKVRALALIKGIEDDAFAYRIEPLLDDVDSHVMAAAIECLAGLKSMGSAARVLGKLRDNCPPEVLRASLEFFANVEIRDESVVLSLVAAYDQMVGQHPDEVGMRLAGLRALVNQLSSGPAVSVAPPILDALSTGPDAIRLALLEVICEKGEDLWMPYAPNLRSKLGRAVIECGKSNTPQVAAASWIAMLLMPDVSPVLSGRRTLWELVGTADEEALACWFEKLSDYRLSALFDQEEDAAGLGVVAGRFGGRFEEDVYDALCQVGSYAALEMVSRTEFEPKGWTKTAVLRALASLHVWNPEFSRLLDSSKSDLPRYVGSSGEAWALLAELKAGRIDLRTLSERFPVDFKTNSHIDERERRAIATVVRDLKGQAGKRPEGRRLGNVLKNLNA
jgi:HEAT repeat protein